MVFVKLRWGSGSGRGAVAERGVEDVAAAAGKGDEGLVVWLPWAILQS